MLSGITRTSQLTSSSSIHPEKIGYHHQEAYGVMLDTTVSTILCFFPFFSTLFQLYSFFNALRFEKFFGKERSQPLVNDQNYLIMTYNK